MGRKAETKTTAQPAPLAPSKIDTVIALLRREEAATLANPRHVTEPLTSAGFRKLPRIGWFNGRLFESAQRAARDDRASI
jgi:hypothetical protein